MSYSKAARNKFIVIYHKSPTEKIKMTKASPYGPALRSVRRFAQIGIEPCEVVEIKRKTAMRKKNKKSKPRPT